jgi:hypothetical protein
VYLVYKTRRTSYLNVALISLFHPCRKVQNEFKTSINLHYKNNTKYSNLKKEMYCFYNSIESLLRHPRVSGMDN